MPSTIRGRPRSVTSVGVSVVRGCLPGATALACAGSSENVWHRDESGKPSAGTTGEALSHAPLAVALTMLRCRSTTFT